MPFTKHFVVLVILFVMWCFSGASKLSDVNNGNTSSTDDYNKYCDLQTKNCNHTIHPLCPTFNPIHYPVNEYIFYPLELDTINFVLTTLNTFRNDLAAGNIAGQKSGSNLRVVKWSADYVRLLKAKLIFRSVCTEISFDGQINVEMIEFVDFDDGANDFYRRQFRGRVFNDSTSNSPWIDSFRAEFDQIGCVYYEYDEFESKTFACFISRYGHRDGEIHIDDLYSYGAPCSKCEGECSDVWPNLCDNSIPKRQRKWNYITSIICVAISSCGVIVIALVFFIIKRPNSKSVKLEMS